MQKLQAKTEAESQIEQIKSQLQTQYLESEVNAKKQLMQYEFDLNSQMKNLELQTRKQSENEREDRKDKRVDQQAMHQKEMIEQRKQGDSLNKFESSGNDILSGGANMEKFDL